MVERLMSIGAEITRRLFKTCKEIAEPLIAAREEAVEKFTKIRQEIADWFKRRRLPDDPAALVRLHWPSLDAESAPFEPLRNRLGWTASDDQRADVAAAADRNVQRVDAALRHTAHEQQNLDRIEAWTLGSGVLLDFVGVGVVLAALNAWLEPGLRDGEWHGFPAAVGLSYAILWTAHRASKLFERPQSGFVTMLVIEFATTVGAMALAREIDGYSEFVLLGGVAAANWIFLCSFGVTIPAVLVNAWVMRRSRRTSPESHILVSLGDVVEVVWRSETGPDRALLEGVAKLERAATVVENDLLTVLIRHGDDQATNDWLTRELRRRAAGLRMLKRQLYLPLDGDVENVATRCGELVVVALDRRWAELPEADPTQVAAARRKPQEVVRSLIVAAVPLMLTAGVDRFSDRVTEPWVWFTAAGWSVIVLLQLIDPQLEEKLDVANRLLPWSQRGPNAQHDGEPSARG